ncbi:MAG: type III pantothenate kinase [Planctomycetia bacterium]|nr:type III pantothenate kinase [Planctomycetia bacterium]
MSDHSSSPLIAVDIGNSRIKLGLFDRPLTGGGVRTGSSTALPLPGSWLQLETLHWHPTEIIEWLAPCLSRDAAWRIATVHRGAAERFTQWLAQEKVDAAQVRLLAQPDLPLSVDLAEPQRVGIDRLLGAVAANVIRAAGEPAIVIDVGTAITVDLVSAGGTFCGGAIVPGIGTSARALHEFTDLLPDLKIATLDEPPPPLGKNTHEAIASGLFWGAVGAMRTLIEQLSAGLKAEPLVLLTGGAMPTKE